MTTDVALNPKPPWEQQARERDFEYAWFVKFAELGDQRSVAKVSAVQGVPLDLVSAAHAGNGWDARAAAYDAVCIDVAQAIKVDESEALAAQYAAGMVMLRLGISAIGLKNPALLKIKDIRELMQFGSEMARRGAGVADLTVEHDVVQRVHDQVLDLLDG